VVEELKLFAYAFLQSGHVAKVLGAFGFEKLYEDKILSMSHWEGIQQAQFDRDLDVLDNAFDAAEEEASKQDATKDEAAKQDATKDEAAKEKASPSMSSLPPSFHCYIFLPGAVCPRIQLRLDFSNLPPPPPTSFRLMTPDEELRYVSIENANRVLVAVSKNFDTLAKKLLAENGYSGFEQRSVELALRQEDFETARFLISAADFPMREAVMAGDLGLVQRLTCYEVDPNDGPCFMERPFQTAIMNGNLEIARYLIWRCNITDLGNLRAPLCLALRKGILEDVQAIINGPRTLTAHDINGPSATMMRVLRENLRIEHNSFLAASSDAKASVGFQILGDQLQDYRTFGKWVYQVCGGCEKIVPRQIFGRLSVYFLWQVRCASLALSRSSGTTMPSF
jgi:hypothetical protein